MADCYIPAGSSDADHTPKGPLTAGEDADLRRLDYLSRSGPLSERSTGRMMALRQRDRRQIIRTPKEFAPAVSAPAKKSFWSRLFG